MFRKTRSRIDAPPELPHEELVGARPFVSIEGPSKSSSPIAASLERGVGAGRKNYAQVPLKVDGFF